MRYRLFCALLLAACGSTQGRVHPDRADEPLPPTKVIFRQYYRGSPIFKIESLSGRDLVELRSKPLEQDQIKIAYVPDDVMRRMLADFDEFGYGEYSGARPPNPLRVGGRAELTIMTENRTVSFIRRDGQGKDAHDTYRKCVDTFRAVHLYYSRYQATRGKGDFGVKKVEFER